MSNTSRAMIDALKKRLSHLASAVEGAEASAMYVSTDFPEAIISEDALFIAEQVQRIQRSTAGIRKVLTNPIKDLDYFSADQAIGNLSVAQVDQLKQFVMSKQEILDYHRNTLATVTAQENNNV